MTSKTELAVIACPDLDWQGPGYCYVCNKDLGNARRRWCGRACERSFLSNHFWGHARKAAIKRDKKTCQMCGADSVPIEVNHIVPIRGKHADMGCHHHLGGLECLCKECHMCITRGQRRLGLLG